MDSSGVTRELSGRLVAETLEQRMQGQETGRVSISGEISANKVAGVDRVWAR